MEKLQFFLFALIRALFIASFIRAQDDQSGFISIDCGISEGTNYTDERTGIRYVSDESFISTGQSYSISPNQKGSSVDRQFLFLRSFPEGTRNCYNLRPSLGKDNKYLIRVRFLYGDYDEVKNGELPVFDIHLGNDYWDTVKLTGPSDTFISEIIHIPSSDIIHVCLINTGFGTPFISALELRTLNKTSYTTDSVSLKLFTRLDLGSTTGQILRYKDDAYDRIWLPSTSEIYKKISTTLTVNMSNGNYFKPPSAVMSSAITEFNSSDPLRLEWDATNFVDEYYCYFYFAELEVLKVNQTREFYVYGNGLLLRSEPFVPNYLIANTFFTLIPLTNQSTHTIVMNKTENSTLPPIVNAVEIYRAKRILGSQTDKKDFDAIMGIKSMYRMERNWQGDPCGPEAYVWIGLNCSYDSFNPPRIISVNLSSSELTGLISPSISNLTMLMTLDLSNNKLTGQVPESFADLKSLKILNLKGNNFTGPVPAKLLKKSQQGLLSLSMDGEDADEDACKNIPCKKKNKVIIPVIASVSALVVVILATLAIFWIIRRRKQAPIIGKVKAVSNNIDDGLESNNKRFSHSEIIKITNNFEKIIGEGGFGTVYQGFLDDKTEVAVKKLSSSSGQGYRELQAEASILINVHHKNLTSMVGYFMEGENMGIIYEYMANGDLRKHLADNNLYTLSWIERLQIAIDAAQGLEYLHHGCNKLVIHRDVKCSNILLDDKFQAKLADFGLSRAYTNQTATRPSTVVAGTPGYLDPEYYMSNKLTEKSDVYSFGVVLLEIFTSRPAIGYKHDPIHVIEWVCTILKERDDVKEIIDSRLMEEFDVNSAWKAIEIAMACVARDSTKRPTMNQVVMEMKESLAIEVARGEPKTEDISGYASPY